MIKFSKKPKKYSFFVKVSREAIQDRSFVNTLKKEYPTLRAKTLPKNILRVKRTGLVIGEDYDDFRFDRKTIRFDFLLYTFKR